MNETNLSRSRSRPEHFANSLLHFELMIIAATMGVICILTIIGNALVLISFAVDKKLRTLNNYFLLSLAVSDMLIGCFSMPVFTVFTVEGEWILGPVVCDMWLAQDYMCSSASGLNLLMISFDRYFSVTRPLQYRAERTGKRVAFMISFVWLFSFFIWTPWIYVWPAYIDGRRTVPPDDCYVQFLETNSYFTVITAVAVFYIPLCIMCVLYFRIWRVTEKRKLYLGKSKNQPSAEIRNLKSVHSYEANPKKGLGSKAFGCFSSARKKSNHSESPKPPEELELCSVAALSSHMQLTPELPLETAIRCNHQTEHESHPSTNDDTISTIPSCIETPSQKQSIPFTLSSNTSVHKSDHKAARTLTAIVFAFIITGTPYNVAVIVKSLDTTLVSEPLWSLFYFLFYINSTLNPICYALANANFRKTYWKILTCSWKSSTKYTFDSVSNKSSQNKDDKIIK